ncbi:restriction endonuclease subunit S [[Ruminococcus] torques]|uniref:Restriction endonuclease subunit S n=1 Tax=[Ruminococcus] torques TaxID=33039 RepID=A0A4Q5C7Y6_9FIRM|nr:restriction endonuclease subunit S [[Ruminococcus] torques]MTQ68831.1 restriction endonuclease subunit S [[Ruminococcus] torques]RYS80298.1 restriction endonuclease subunit S [[Ruminococcus] torques]
MKCKLEDIVDVTMGQSPKSEYYNTEGKGYPFLQGNRTFGFKYPTFDTYTTVMTKPANAGDVIMSVRAPVGDLNITPVDMCLGRGVCSLRMKNGNQDFLFYMMKYYIPHLLKKESGTVFGSVNRNDINGLEIDIPEDAQVQKKIARYLEMIDDKIELNNAINNNLEQQAQAIFKSWFIDFEPFSNRKPNDWSISTLGNVSIMGAGGDKPQNVSPIKTDLYEYPIYSNGLSDEGLYGFTDKPKISEESVTVSARGTIGFVCLRHIPYVPIVRLVTLIPKTEIISAKYLYLWLKQLHITGTGTTQQQLTVPDFQKTEILVPSQEIVTLFTATVEPIFEKIWANQNENEKLSSLRDTLLPKLMSGELDVSNIEL